jgi:hypothetical protein
MKKMICEMCESTDFVKQEGVFVCQSCGMKYSVEDAKKLMGDGTVEEVKKVTVDDTAKLDNLYMLACRAKDENNVEKAAQYYEQILQESPNSWEAMFYSNYYASILKWQDDKELLAISSLQNSIGNVVDIISGSDERYVAVLEITKKLVAVGLLFGDENGKLFDSFYNQYKNAGSSSHNDRLLAQKLSTTSDINLGIARIWYTFGATVYEKANNTGDLDHIVEAAIADAINMADRNPCGYVLETYRYIAGFYNISALANDTSAEVYKLKESGNKILQSLREKKERKAREEREKWEQEHPVEAKKQREEQEEKERLEREVRRKEEMECKERAKKIAHNRKILIPLGAILGGIIFGLVGKVAGFHAGLHLEDSDPPIVILVLGGVAITMFFIIGLKANGMKTGCTWGCGVGLGLFLVIAGMAWLFYGVLKIRDVVSDFAIGGILGVAFGWLTSRLICNVVYNWEKVKQDLK